MSSSNQVPKLYQTVVEDVIGGVRDAFLDEGVDQSVLAELKQLWVSKLAQSKAVETRSGDNEQKLHATYAQAQSAALGQQVQHRVLTGVAAAARAPQQIQLQTVQQTAQSQQLARQQQLTTPTLTQQHLAQQQLPTAVINPATGQLQMVQAAPIALNVARQLPGGQITLQAGGPRVYQPGCSQPPQQQQYYTQQQYPPSCQEAGVTSHYDQQQQHYASDHHLNAQYAAHAQSYSHAQAPSRHYGYHGYQVQGQAGQQLVLTQVPHATIAHPTTTYTVPASTANGTTGKHMVQLDGQNDTSSDDDDDDDDDDNDNDDNDEQEENQAQEEEPLNSGDDVSEADPQEVFETDNVIVCQYDKINRNKNKWKFNLKDGIMNLNGRDYVFQKASGESEW